MKVWNHLQKKQMLKKLINIIKRKIKFADELARSHSTDILESEITQLESIFANLVFGNFVGIPSAPIQISFYLLSEAEESIEFLTNRMMIQNDPLGELASIFRID